MILGFFELLMERAGATKRDKIEDQLNGRKLRKGATLRKQGERERKAASSNDNDGRKRRGRNDVMLGLFPQAVGVRTHRLVTAGYLTKTRTATAVNDQLTLPAGL